MTITNKYIDPIIAESTPGGFIRSAGLLPANADWTGGITFSSSCGGTDVWSCSYGVDKQNITDKGDPVEFDPFIVYAGKRCSGAPDVANLTELATIALKRGISGSLARELHSSDPTIGNPDLVTTATDITPGAAPCVQNAIAGLMSAAGECGGGPLTFHVPFVALASLMSMSLVEFSDGRYRLGGHTIIVDDYPNEPPTGGAVAAANEVWLYATGPVEYKLGERIDVGQFTERLNESIVIAEQLAIIRFDPCCVFAILAEIC
jgi:hypothetical protein